MDQLLAQSSLAYSVGIFLLAAVAIGIFGIRMTHLARDLAQVTGMGEAFTGAVFIGATTSLSGIVASATAAWRGDASLAVSNSLGGIAAQTLFLVLGDALYRKANLEHAAASVENMMMSAQLMLLLCIVVAAFNVPGLQLWGIHPASVVLVCAYLLTLKLLVDTHENPMWIPRITRETITVEAAENPDRHQGKLAGLIIQFLICAIAVGLAGWAISSSAIAMVERTGLSSGVVGGTLVAITTSLPELVVAITAIRMGSLTLAVGDIIGGNAFDTLFVAVADMFYRDGSIYASIASTEKVWLSSAMLMNAILLLGLMYRERKGIANMGSESVLMLVVYVSTLAYLGF